MANGYAPYLLKTVSEVVASNDPMAKVTPTGCHRMLMENPAQIKVLQLSDQDGHEHELRLKYKQRNLDSEVSESDNCDIDVIPVWKEIPITAPQVAKIGLYISEAEMTKYMNDASQTVALGKPSTTFMREHLSDIIASTNAMMNKIDKKLISLITFGTNVTTGNNAAKTINIQKDATINDLSSGVVEMLGDAADNEMTDLMIVGSGLMNKYEIQKAASTAGMSGLDISRLTGYNWYFDVNTKAGWGENHVGVFSKGSIGFVDIDKYVGFKAGKRGGSEFLNLPLPVAGTTNSTAMQFNVGVQLKYEDCEFQAYNPDYDEIQTYKRGWRLMLIKNYGLFQVPNDAYKSGDRLTQNNGALRYEITNNT